MDMITLFDVVVTVGVDTHADTHTAVALDQRGARLDAVTVANTTAGFASLLEWAEALGVIDRFGIEGTGSYGAGLARWLADRGMVCVEVHRPDRADRRRRGKSDPLDAEQAARAVQAGTATGTPKAGNGPVESLRVLRVARRSARSTQTRLANQLHGLRTTAPQHLADQLRGLSTVELAATCARLRPGVDPCDLLAATKHAMRRLARRWQQLRTEIAELDDLIDTIVGQIAPTLRAQRGVGPDTASGLLVAAGDNPTRLHSEAAFAAICGTNPVPASSGKTQRHRLNRGGNRDANRCIHTVAITRLATERRSRDYVQRRMREDKRTKREAIRCLKRYITRDLYNALMTDFNNPALTRH